MKTSLPALLLLATPLSAITIRIDYTYDTANFFNTPEKKSAMEAVAEFYGSLLQDHLAPIDQAEYPGSTWTAITHNPSTGADLQIPNLVVEEDTLIVFVGARDLGGNTRGQAGPGGYSASGSSDWLTLIDGRGNPGAEPENTGEQTDTAPWGGFITFDIDSVWNFSLTNNLAGTEFITVALHEMAHVLGIGTAPSWRNLVLSGNFTGFAANRSYGSNPPATSGHYGGAGTTSEAFGSFGAGHGVSQQLLMLPLLTDNGSTFIVASDLDLAGLRDIGWEVLPAPTLAITALGPSAASFTWNSTSFFDYRVQRGSGLQTYPGGSAVTPGTGDIQSWTDPSPPASRAFYRLAATPVHPPATIAAASFLTRSSSDTSIKFKHVAPQVIECGTGR